MSFVVHRWPDRRDWGCGLQRATTTATATEREVRKGNGVLDWVAVMASQRIGPPYGLAFRSRMSPGTQRNSARISLGWQAADVSKEGAVNSAEEPPRTGDDE